MHCVHVRLLLGLAADRNLAMRLVSGIIPNLFVAFCDWPRLAVAQTPLPFHSSEHWMA